MYIDIKMGNPVQLTHKAFFDAGNDSDSQTMHYSSLLSSSNYDIVIVYEQRTKLNI